MIKTILAVVLPVAALVSVGQVAGSSSQDAEALRLQSDRKAIIRTALDYGRGYYEGDADRMERALHPDLAKRTPRTDPLTGRVEIDHMSAMRLVQITRAGYGKRVPESQQRTDVTVMDIFGNAACVKLEMHDWIDYMQMAKVDDRWVIVNVLWELTPRAKAERAARARS